VLVPPGVGADLYLWAGAAVGEGACRAFDSTFTLGRGGLLRIAPPEVDTSGCDPETAAIDDVFFRHLADTSTWEVSGSQMTLSDAAGEPLLTFTSAVVPEDPSVAPWRLARITSADGSPGRAVEGSDAGLQFLPGGRVVGRTGCGRLLGSYSTNGTTIDITDLQHRLTDCTGEIRSQAEQLISALPRISDFTLRPAGLSLSDETGVTRLAFVPDIRLGQRTWTPTEVMNGDGEVVLDDEALASSSIRFGNAGVDGRTLCRRYSGESLRSGLALTVFELAPVKGSCRAADDEAAYLGALRGVASHALRGSELQLLDKDGEPVVRLQEQAPLLGVDWQLSRIDMAARGQKVKRRAPVSETPLRATFVEDGVLVGTTGVNSFDATYEAGGSAIDITAPQTSGAACRTRAARRSAGCRLEVRYLDFLDRVDQYVVSEDRLVLLAASRPLLEFVPAQDADDDAG
jgi:heat shock protein HslJ